jgi:RNA-directed DNA polymerase
MFPSTFLLIAFLSENTVSLKLNIIAKAGTPQGGIISPFLANMTLDGIEKLLMAKYPKRNKNSTKVNFVRYCDDFIVTANSEETAREIKNMIITFLQERGLELSDDKTLITSINEGFDFLGWNCATRSCFRDYGSIRPLSA